MSYAAFGGFLIYLLITLGWRSWRQHQRTGDWGFSGRTARSAGEWFGGTLLVTGGLFSLAATILDFAKVLGRLDALSHPAVQGVGLVLALLAFGLTVVAQLQMGDAWRVGVDPADQTSLVTQGIFRFIRNPIFTGMIAFVVGIFLMVPSLLALAGFILLTVGLEIQVRWVEEPYLLQTHGEQYREYVRSTGRFVPRLGRYE